MTPEQIESLRHQLPPFEDDVEPAPEVQEFCRDYGIDFATRLPHVKHRAGYVHSGSYKLAVHYWHQPDASSNLLLLHGYFDHTGIFDKLIAWGLSRNCNVLIFDLPGHGLSSGEPAVIDDFADYSRAISDVLAVASLPQIPLWVMAQSTGGAALIGYALKNAWPFDATVLLAPLIRPSRWPAVRGAHFLLSPFLSSVRRTFAANSSDQAFLKFLKRDPLQSDRISLRWVGALRRWLRGLQRTDLGVGPALIIQGDTDATVDWRYNVGFVCQLFSGSKVELLHGAGHQLANESVDFRSQYLDCVESWLSQCGVTLGADSGIEPR